jgi:hypothetical protein
MNAIQGYLEKLGSNFMIAAFAPSLAFVAVSTIAFSPLLPPTLIQRVQSALSPINDSGLIVLLIATMMGFTLTSLNTYIYKLFEGYFLRGLLKPLLRIELRRARIIRNKRDFLNKKINRIEKWQRGRTRAKLPAYQKKKLIRINNRIQQLINQRDALAAEYDSKYPPTDALIMPTRLGNILRAAEAYPQSRYYADSVALWPRMVWAVDREYMSHVDSANDQCSFLLNSSLLSGIFAVMSFTASGYELASNVSSNPVIYLAVGIFALAIAWFFYTASLLNVTKYGNLIRSSYDLFRFNLLDKLHLKLPPNSESEKELWEQISEFITIGDLFEEKTFVYPSHADKEDEEEAELRSLIDNADLSEDST